MAITLRTMSQLPRIPEDELINDRETAENYLIQTSVNRDGKYISKTFSLKQIDNHIEKVYNLVDDNGDVLYINQFPAQLSNLDERISAIERNDVEINGKKTFTSTIKYKDKLLNYESIDKKSNELVTVNYVEDALNANISRITGQSSYGQDGVNTYIANNGVITGKPFVWTFDNDSNQFLTNSVEITKTGWLNMYGWLADIGNVDAAAAWVAVVNSSSANNEIIQLQPWNIGSKHANMQYVNFAFPIKAGTRLAVAVGFELNYSNSSYQTRFNSLVKNTIVETPGVNITNGFIGYVF